MPKILLIDGYNYLFRAFHALPPLTTSTGEPTGALKGFSLMLKNVRESVAPDYAACVFDAPGKNFRHDIYPQYKANRPPTPEELKSQIPAVFELVRLSGWPLIQVPGVEADDVLATLALRAAARGIEAVIATGDKDLAQIVGPKVTLYNTMTETRLDRAGVKEKYGVPPERIVDYLALMGDKVDNVPGISKCGPKTAVKWIEAYGGLDGVAAHAAEVKGKIGEYLRAGLPFLETARRLVTVNTNVGLEQGPEDLVIADPDRAALQAFYLRWEMKPPRMKPAAPEASEKPAGKRMKMPPLPVMADLFDAASVPSDIKPAAPAGREGFTVADSEERLDELRRELEAAGDAVPVGVALATDRSSFMHDLPCGIAFCTSPFRRFYVPTGHLSGNCVSRELLAEKLGAWFSGPAPKAFHDMKLARHALAGLGIELGGAVHDVMLMSYVIEAHLRHDVSSLSSRWLASVIPGEESLTGRGKSRKAVSSLSVGEAGTYLAAQAGVLRALSAVLLTRIGGDPDIEQVYTEIELPLNFVLWKMERLGVTIDSGLLAAQSRELGERIEEIREKINLLAGEEINPSSPRQLARILFEKLGMPVKKKTPSGTPSTDEEVLAELALDWPLPKEILEFRRLDKLKGTYTDKLPAMVDSADGRIHTTFGQATAVTGRLASSDPNLQNIPVRTPEGRKVREAFVAPPGYRIISADYSQVELRIMAHISGDPGLVRAFREGADIHRATAAEVFSVHPSEVTADQRRMAKVINFGLIYGMSSFGLAQNLGLSRSVAAHYIGEYFARYPYVAEYMEQTRTEARRCGYVSTAFGRRLWLPDIMSPRAQVRAAAERAAINAPMQGTAADLIKMAMVSVAGWLASEKLRSRMVLQVHDELVLEVPEDEVEIVRAKLPELMAGAATLDVPLIAQVGVADNWEAAH